MGMMPKFSSPAADYVEKRLSLDEICISSLAQRIFYARLARRWQLGYTPMRSSS